jgi:hypothetical protein
MKFERTWAMPNSDTFSVPCIGEWVQRWLAKSKHAIDPFARNFGGAYPFTNDLNPNTQAREHLDAEVFLKKIFVTNGCVFDLAIFDPPYSPRQISECYQEAGIECGMKETQNAALYSRVRNQIPPLLDKNGIVLSFGWNSAGMGKERGFEIVEILLVCHGGAHNDTICIAEQKLPTLL